MFGTKGLARKKLDFVTLAYALRRFSFTTLSV